MRHHSVNNNTRMGLVIFLCSNANHLISLIPPQLPQILDIYSVVVLPGFWLVGIGFSVRLHFRCGWCGCSVVGLGSLGVTLGVFLVHCVLCCAGGFLPSMLVGLMDDETSCHYIFLFMLLPIPFLVIGLSIKENI